MGKFHGEVIVKPAGDMEWSVYETFDYAPEKYPMVVVEKGFITDFASVPRGLWNIFPPYGRYTAAAVVHDKLYSVRGKDVKPERSRAQCDEIFKEAMKDLGVEGWKRNLMYAAVRAFGWVPWRKK